MSDVPTFVPLIHHVPFVLVFLVGAVLAARRYRAFPFRMRLLLVGLALLLLERAVSVWLHFADLAVVPPETAMSVARRISAVIYFDWALSVLGIVFVVWAALSREELSAQGVMPNTSFERTREG
jgi:4-amino-4-deoxy-L-arabinose transferase-like glycosyltransferase